MATLWASLQRGLAMQALGDAIAHARSPIRTKENPTMTSKKLALPRPSRRNVPMGRIETREEAFQPRGSGLQANHVAALCDVLERGDVLDPIAVWEDPDSGALVVADGHHRLAAYRQQRQSKPIPVLVFACDYRTAMLIPVRDNAKNRLALSHEDKSNWAWRIVNEGGHSKANIAKMCGVSARTVAYMRAALKKLQDAGEDVPNTWPEAQRAMRGDDPTEWTEADRDEWKRGLVAKADRQFGASLAHLCKQSTEAAAELLERCAGGDLGSILDHLGYGPVDEDGNFFLPQDDEDAPFSGRAILGGIFCSKFLVDFT
ncbi:MAG: ParB N-terminal domain-containing protein [Vibrio fluvialis]